MFKFRGVLLVDLGVGVAVVPAGGDQVVDAPLFVGEVFGVPVRPLLDRGLWPLVARLGRGVFGRAGGVGVAGGEFRGDPLDRVRLVGVLAPQPVQVRIRQYRQVDPV